MRRLCCQNYLLSGNILGLLPVSQEYNLEWHREQFSSSFMDQCQCLIIDSRKKWKYLINLENRDKICWRNMVELILGLSGQGG